MITHVVNIRNIKSSFHRLDPSFHLSDAVVLQENLAKFPGGIISLKDATKKVFLGNIFSRNFVKDKEHGVPYLAASDTVLANLETGKYLSKRQAQTLKYLMLQKDWIVITCSGTIGNVTYTNRNFEHHIATHDLVRIIPDDTKLLKGYLYAFLSSKYGYMQLTQSKFGGVIKHINAEHVNSISLPLLNIECQKEIDQQITTASSLREQAFNALESAISLLENTLNIKTSKKKYGSINCSKILMSYKNRFEANYHISKGSEVESFIKQNFKWKLLSEVCNSISRPELFKRYYVKEGITFLGSSDIFLATPKSTKRLSKVKTLNINELFLEEGMILIPRSGTVGDVAIAHFGHAQKLASEDVIRLKPNDILRGGYVFAFLASMYGKELIKKHVFGSVIQHIEAPHLGQIPIPIIDDNIMKSIHDKVYEYCCKMGEAIKLETKAISSVENILENY